MFKFLVHQTPHLECCKQKHNHMKLGREWWGLPNIYLANQNLKFFLRIFNSRLSFTLSGTIPFTNQNLSYSYNKYISHVDNWLMDNVRSPTRFSWTGPHRDKGHILIECRLGSLSQPETYKPGKLNTYSLHNDSLTFGRLTSIGVNNLSRRNIIRNMTERDCRRSVGIKTVTSEVLVHLGRIRVVEKS